ncbi:hypothetical protein QBC33DRAFT_534418 [Phialemonium atrogriseum]|uniref:Uncharacterized protein n=1 Tax=Phialemonium atrogriseum TaxID=1093897 RepID=A0AAJ0FNH0_9PEZI|nr:uncharacterized protein QBC33DRAFT_534418 [Phialemonium atrogriseum]KAK1768989.1 hypothetical protein QBC33DRAFT_534418 [Phialemonium atrogriseum]
MARLSGDVCLPSGSLEHDTLLSFPPGIASDPPSSVISPFALPRGSLGYFDQPIRVTSQANNARLSTIHAEEGQASHSNKGRPNNAYSPIPPGRPGTSVSQSWRLFSPREAPYQQLQSHQQGAAALSPPIPADAPSPPSQAQVIRRLTQQNGRIREAWEAERKYLEANRERAEEVYKEERGLMEEERAEWEAEREGLLRQIASLRQQVAGLGGDGPSANTDGLTNGGESPMPDGLRGGGGWDLSPESMASPGLSQGNARPRQRHGPGSGDTSRKHPPPVACIADALAPPAPPLSESRFPPPRRFESSSFPPTANNGFPPTPEQSAMADKEDMTPEPTVDVQEIIPTLEGIPIKAAAIQRPTFTFTDPKASPPADQPPPGVPRRASNKQQTLQVLAADATDRLTMHAGHTPSHSLSVLPTVTTASVVTTASSSGDSTPTPQQCDGFETDVSTEAEPLEPFTSIEQQPTVTDQDHPEPKLEPDEDVELNGPLMLRNMPAHDEVFFQRLSDKLEEVSRASNAAAVPAVLKDSPESEEPASSQENGHGRGNHDGGARDAIANKDRSSSRSSDEEMDIPLKIRRNNNFGAPFGVFR